MAATLSSATDRILGRASAASIPSKLRGSVGALGSTGRRPETPDAATTDFHEFLRDAAIYGVTTASMSSMRRELTQLTTLTGMGRTSCVT